MSTKNIVVSPIGRWGRFPTFPGKVGTHASCNLIIKRSRVFHVEQRIEFVPEHTLNGCSKQITPQWQQGIIWKIEGGRIFVNYL